MADASDHLRASDAEREQIIEALRQHTADGRLTMAEFEDRVEQVYAAVTRADLRPALEDLPPLDVQARPRPDASTRIRRSAVRLPSVRTVAAIVAAVFAVVLFTQGVWWIIFPLMGVFCGFGGCGRASRCATGRGGHDADVAVDAPPERDLIRV